MGDLIVSQGTLPDKAAAERLVLDVTGFEANALNLVEQAERAEITDEATYAKGGDLVKIANQQIKAVDAKRTAFVKPFNDMVKFVNEACKPAKTNFEKAQKVIKDKMLAWKREEDRKRAEEARKAQEKLEQEALERAAASATEEDQDAVIEAAVEASAQMEERSKVGAAYGNYGTTSGRKVYRTEITDMAAFLNGLTSEKGQAFLKKIDLPLGAIVDFRKAGLNKLAQLALEAGVTEASGAKFEQDEQLRVV